MANCQTFLKEGFSQHPFKNVWGHSNSQFMSLAHCKWDSELYGCWEDWRIILTALFNTAANRTTLDPEDSTATLWWLVGITHLSMPFKFLNTLYIMKSFTPSIFRASFWNLAWRQMWDKEIKCTSFFLRFSLGLGDM